MLKGDKVKQCNWHPHSNYTGKNNTIYVATDNLTIDGKKTDLPGAGTFRFSPELVLTKAGMSRSKWELPECLKNSKISYHSDKNFKDGYFQSASRGQEFVVDEDAKVTEWAYNMIARNFDK